MYDNYMRIVNVIHYIIYARLSKEEIGKNKDEQSRSIKNQIAMCHKYIEEEKKTYPNCQFIEVAVLKDDGVSGTTFDREDFKKLVNLIEKKQVNMVITKDLSRLGRDHIKTDDYIEKWFPEHNVRYVSIMENVDTYAECVSNEIAPIINWANDNFARQTSKKIKKTFKDYREKGKWTGGEPPLGYMIDPKDKHHFVIEPKGKEIVQRIFSLAKENNTPSLIANILTKEKVPIPAIIKKTNRNLNKEICEIWSSETVKDILTNEMYLGHMIQGKTTRLSHKSKKIIYLPKEKWIKVKNTHEPIIDEETFNLVQSLISSNKNKNIKTYDYLLKGLMICSECKHSIGIQHYNNRKYKYTTCNYYRKYGSKKDVCTAHRFIYEEIENLVLENIKNECIKYVDSTNFVNMLKDKEQSKQVINDMKQKIDKCNREIEKINKQIDEIYNDKLNGLIDIEQYERMTKSKYQLLEYEKTRLNRYDKDLSNAINKREIEPDYIKIVKEFLDLKNINKVIITKLIDKIYLSEDGIIDIHYKFQNPYRENNN